MLAMTTVLALVGAGCAHVSPDTSALPFVTHAAFFSAETKQQRAIDPQVFVRDATAVAEVGPQNIRHAAGVRPAFVDEPKDTAILTADGRPLAPLTLGSWLAARGSVSISRLPDGRGTIESRFSGLQPGGLYSLFENHFDQKPVGFTPLDGTANGNTFKAGVDGMARLTLTAPAVPGADNAVLLVYHSDGQSHGPSRGQIGIDAHHLLIAKTH